MKSIGETLRENREKSGIDIEEASRALKIRCEYLKALEKDSFDGMRADVYTRGYIREYAKFLGINPEPLISEYTEKMNAGKQQPDLPGLNKEALPASPPAKKSFNYLPVLLIVSVIFFFIASVYVYYRRSLVLKGEGEYIRAPSSMPDGGNNPSLPAASDKGYTLELTARERTWLRIEPGDGEPEEVMMEPGESMEWEARGGFEIKVGNAGGVSAVLNGKDIGLLGKRGQVIKIRLPSEKP